jgi:hypothetical protein
MKRFWLILLSLGLITAFSTQAFAVDVKFSGEFYVAGMYLDKTDLRDEPIDDGPSTAFFYQRLRLRTDFIVSPGLSFITRADIMERVWGGKRAASGVSHVTGAGRTAAATPVVSADTGSAQTAFENENIAVDWAYINYVSPIGIFDVGYMNYGATGTVFGNNSTPQARIKYSYTTGPATLNLAYSKVKDQSLTTRTVQTHTDVDNDVYHVEGVYTWKTGKAGLNVNYYHLAEYRPTANYIKDYFLFTPYAITKIGPVTLQAELNYATGKARRWDSDELGTRHPHEQVALDNISAWVDATADFNQFYFGGTVAYVSGDDWKTAHEDGGTINGGIDWNPCLILFNQDRTYWQGTLNGYGFLASSSSSSSPMTNAWFYQGRVGVRPTAAWDIMASVSYADADQRPQYWVHRSYGWEADLTATYKITPNLSYMVGGGYFWTGNYYEGASEANSGKLNNDYMLINKLTLTF